MHSFSRAALSHDILWLSAFRRSKSSHWMMLCICSKDCLASPSLAKSQETKFVWIRWLLAPHRWRRQLQLHRRLGLGSLCPLQVSSLRVQKALWMGPAEGLPVSRPRQNATIWHFGESFEKNPGDGEQGYRHDSKTHAYIKPKVYSFWQTKNKMLSNSNNTQRCTHIDNKHQEKGRLSN